MRREVGKVRVLLLIHRRKLMTYNFKFLFLFFFLKTNWFMHIGGEQSPCDPKV